MDETTRIKRNGKNSAEDGIFVVTDMPSNVSIEFGIDCMTYETGQKFKGIGLIPSGIHFIYYSTGMGARQGSFMFFDKGVVEVRTWNAGDEELSTSNILSSESMESLRQSLIRGELNDSIGPYPFSQRTTWLNLTSFIHQRVLQRADADFGTLLYPGDSNEILVAAYSKLKKGISSTDLIPHFPNAARVARFCDLKSFETHLREQIIQVMASDAMNKDDNSNRSNQLTRMHMDKSDVLESMIQSHHHGHMEDLLGEIQLAFVLFITLYSYPALEYWKLALHFVCSSETFLISNPTFTIGFIRTLYEQINFAPSDFFEDELSKDNFLRPCFTNLFSALSDITSSSPIFEHKRRFQTFVSKKFGIQENILDTVTSKLDETMLKQYLRDFCGDDDSMPVIVDFIDDSKIPSSLEEDRMDTEQHDHEQINMKQENESTTTSMGNDWKVYSWRYPLLYESMQCNNKNEDCVMTAARIMDEFGYILNNQQGADSRDDKMANALKSLVNEARMFIEILFLPS